MTIERQRDYDYPGLRIYAVKSGDAVIGLIEKRRHEWKSFLGSGFFCKTLSTHRSRKAAIDAVVETAGRNAAIDAVRRQANL